MRLIWRILYWILAAVLAVAALLDLDYSISQTIVFLLISSLVVVTLEFFMHKMEDKMHRVYICLAILGVVTVFFFVLVLLLYGGGPMDSGFVGKGAKPQGLIIAVLLEIVLISLSVADYFWGRWLQVRYPSSDGTVSFFSNRKSVSIKVSDIVYIESNDTEVRIVTASGESYRNKMGILRWSEQLGDGFLRIHRSYLVNVEYASLVFPDLVSVGATTLPVSRKYRKVVEKKFSK